MNKPLDRLFKEKLSNHQLPPSETAWSKVEASLDSNKRGGVIWFRAAVAVVLLAVLTATILWVRSGDEKVIAKVDSVRVTPKPKATPAPKKIQRIQERKLPVVKSSSRRVNVFIAKEEDKKELTTDESPVQQEQQPVAIVNEPQQPLIQNEKPEVATKKSPITLTYTLAPIPSRKKKTPAAEERNGLQKVVDVAMEAKNSDGTLAELRTMKDDLFALNFKKNNKK